MCDGERPSSPSRAASGAGCRDPRARRARRGRDLDAVDGAARDRTSRRERIRRVERERAVGARAGPACPSRSARAWRVPDGGKFAGMRTIVVSMPCASSTLPEGFGPSCSSSTRPAVERHLPSSQRTKWLGGSVRVVDRIRRHRLRVAVDEVEDAVAAGVEAGDERRPCHGALRRDRGAERGERRRVRRASRNAAAGPAPSDRASG